MLVLTSKEQARPNTMNPHLTTTILQGRADWAGWVMGRWVWRVSVLWCVAAPVALMRTRLFLARKVFMLTVFMLLSMLSPQLSRSAVRVLEHEHESLQSHVLPALSTASDLCVPQRQRARDSGPQCGLVPFSVRIPSAEWDLRFAFPLAEGRAIHPTKLPVCAASGAGRDCALRRFRRQPLLQHGSLRARALGPRHA